MLNPTLTIKETIREDDHIGRKIIRFQPVFRPDVTAHGELAFAFYEKWEDEPETHAEAKHNALSNAIKVMETFAKVAATCMAVG